MRLKKTAIEWLAENYLPLKRGIELGNLLSLEFEKSNPKMAGIVASIPGRLYFLKSVEFISDQAKSLGADLVLQQSILRVENEIQ